MVANGSDRGLFGVSGVQGAGRSLSAAACTPARVGSPRGPSPRALAGSHLGLARWRRLAANNIIVKENEGRTSTYDLFFISYK